MDEHKRTHGQLIEQLSKLHDDAEKHAQALLHINNEIHILEQELVQIQKPAEDWE